MKITMEATEKITTLDGVQGRIWEGTTEVGTKCIVFVHRIAVAAAENQAEFEKELREMMPPGKVYELRHIL